MSSPSESPTGPCDQILRTDAARNREKILDAAREVFAEDGLDAPMAEVARRAEVGIATLYRRFPTREDLIAATFAGKMATYADAVEQALADPDPWHGFCTYVERVCGMQAADHGFTDVLTMTFPTAEALEAERSRAYRGFAKVVARAKAAGRLRTDFSDRDLVILLMANAGVINATGDDAPDAWRRLVAYMLQAFAVTTGEPLPPAPKGRDLFNAMVHGQHSHPATHA
ncbi:TetR/AcrR family transcriptional regulator [Occultella kanbiaonis]|uniref:TetR/AcrR family transcriptional regulator n=1 Tax=Occultella kanbiaonis TaxID=2675754 RepID=UPI0012B75D61|nr:TetR/AcrR family transcriptional regulator [Occultella kanbiaonis]